MPTSLARSLELTLTKTFGHCYSMDATQVPLLGQVKDAQVALAIHPAKRMKLTILVADILAHCGMLLSRSFCKDMGGEIKMDWSHAIILVGTKKIKLEPEEKAKFTVMKFDDPKAQILYQEMEFNNYMMFSDLSHQEQMLEHPNNQNIWTLEFDGSYAIAGSRDGIVLILP